MFRGLHDLPFSLLFASCTQKSSTRLCALFAIIAVIDCLLRTSLLLVAAHRS
jgi:hypothetical protein